MTLLAFALARGSVAKVLQALSCISDHLETQYKASLLIMSMASVRLRLLNRHGKLIWTSFSIRHLTASSQGKCFECREEM